MANKKYKLTDGNMWATDGIHDFGQNKTQRTINSEVNTALGGKAPTNHASTSTTYGKGTSSNYGHVKISDSLTDTTPAATGGVVPSMKAVSDLSGAVSDLTDYTHNVSTAKIAANNTTNISSGTITSIKSGNLVQISGQIKAASAGIGAWLQTLCTLSSEAKASTARTVWAYANYNNNWEFVALELLADGTLRTRISSGSGNKIVGNSWITIPNQIIFD